MKLQVVSRGYYVLRILVCIATGLFLTLLVAIYLNLKDALIIFILINGLFTYLAIRITAKADKGEIELEILHEGLKIAWLKQFLLHKRASRVISWNEIESYVFEPDQHYDMLKIRLKSKEKIKFSLRETTKDFFKFLTKFERKINEKKSIDSTITITKAKTVYETTFALVAAYILGVLIVGLLYFLIFGEPKKSPNYGLLITYLSGAFFFIIQVYNYRQRSKKTSKK